MVVLVGDYPSIIGSIELAGVVPEMFFHQGETLDVEFVTFGGLNLHLAR